MHENYHLGVKALIKNDEDRYLLLKATVERESGREPYWELPGGRVEKGESIKDALAREIREETNLQLKNYKSAGMFLTNIRINAKSAEVGLILEIYECRVLGKTVKLSSEHSDHGWFTGKDAQHLLKSDYPADLLKLLK